MAARSECTGIGLRRARDRTGRLSLRTRLKRNWSVSTWATSADSRRPTPSGRHPRRFCRPGNSALTALYEKFIRKRKKINKRETAVSPSCHVFAWDTSLRFHAFIYFNLLCVLKNISNGSAMDILLIFKLIVTYLKKNDLCIIV